MKLTAKFLLMLLGIPFIILALTSTITFVIQKNTIEQEILIQQEYLVNEVANGINAELLRLGQKTIDMASLPIVEQMLENPPELGYVQEVYQALPGYDEYLETVNGFIDESVALAYIISEETGSLFINTWIQVPPDYDGRENDYYQGPVKAGGVYVTEPYLNPEGVEGTDPTAVTISYPIKDNGKLLGVSAIDIGLGRIVSYAKEIGNKHNAVIGVFTTSGSVIFHPKVTDTSVIVNFSDLLKALEIQNTKEVEDVLYGGVTGRVIVDGANDSYAIATPVPGTNWMVSVSFPVSDVTNKTTSSVLPVTITSAVILLLTLLAVAIIFNQTVIKNILLTSENLKVIASGDLLVEVDSSLLTRKDEIGILAKSLHDMTTNWRDIVSKVTAAANYIASGSMQVSDSSQLLSSGATEQAASAEEVSSSMEEMSANITQNADNSSQTEKIAIKAARDARESGETVSEAVEAMTLIANKITIIEEISRSTNLLALNAAIEAARAGEHGKGFAVVATEVRKLAEQSQKAAGDITELAAKTVELSQGSGERLSKLVPDIERTAELVEEISAASNEQQSGVDQITSAIHQLDKTIQSNASSSEELASTSEQLAAQAEQLKETIQYFRISKDQKKTTKKPAAAVKKEMPIAEKPAPVKKAPATPLPKAPESKETGITISPNQSMSSTLSEDDAEKLFDDDFETF